MKIKGGWRRVAKWAIWSVITLVFLGFLIRVATFEAWYYNEKEGSERAAVAAEESTLDETVLTEEEIIEYTVAADRPRYLSIEKLGITNARVLAMGINSKGEMATPNNIFDVGWYEGSGKPGQGGTMIIDGHNGGPNVYGVFKKLPDLVTGDIIKIERGDGAIFNYKVVENVTVALAESDDYMIKAAKSPEKNRESITLITCTGEWSSVRQTYLSRQFTRAVLVEK